MGTSFRPGNGAWDAPWPQRISQHDIVCLSPPMEPMQGLALGNGDVGALVWCEPRRLVMVVNKCDLWDDLPDDDLAEMHREAPHWEDRHTALRHGCRLELDLVLPLLDSWYLTDFEARLDLARGRARVHAVSPLGTVDAEVFVSAADKVVAVSYAIQTQEPIRPRVVVERWGSRTFNGWYNQHQPDASVGLAGTETEVDGQVLLLHQQFRDLRFAVATGVRDGGQGIAPTREHSRCGAFALPAKDCHRGDVFLAVATSEESADCVGQGKRLIAAAQAKGIPEMARTHDRDWRDFWECGGWIQTSDRFLDMLWHLMLYYANSSQRGRYPGLFTQSLWSWNRDFQPWGSVYFHWNQQQSTWPLPAAGHAELMQPYLDFRFAMLDRAKASAAETGNKGAFYADVASRTGQQAPQPNRTPGGQVAGLFWTHYRYTGDVDYLRRKGWPVIAAVAEWHYDLLERKDDGLYHTTPGWGYEGHNMLRDCTSELVTTRQVFEIALAVSGILGVDHPDVARWRDALDHLAPLVAMESPVNPGVEIIAAGYQKGTEKNAGTGRRFEAGPEEDWRGATPTCSHDPKSWGQIFSDVETSPVFPAGQIGLKDKGTRAFALAEATARECNMYWTSHLVHARLGHGEEVKKDIAGRFEPGTFGLDASSSTGWTCTGFWMIHTQFGDIARIANALLAPDDYRNTDVKGPEWKSFMTTRVPVRMWEYRHIYQEPLHATTAAIGESLLQSHEGVIRIAPAVAPGDAFAFTLSAEGGFVVSACGAGDRVDWVHVRSRRGGECRVANPWPGQAVFLRAMDSASWEKSSGAEIVFATQAGAMVLLAREPIQDDAIDCAIDTPRVATGPCTAANGKTTLGIPCMFVSATKPTDGTADRATVD